MKCDDEFLGCLAKFIQEALRQTETNLTSMHPLFKKNKLHMELAFDEVMPPSSLSNR